VRERILISLGALLSFGGTLAASFVYDDFFMFHDPAITEPSGWLQCWRPIKTRPLTWFTFWISDRFHGTNPLGWHIAGLLLHVACALLVWDILRKLIPPRAAFLAAMIFAVHPVMTEPVAYIFARATLLGGFFSLLAIRSWIARGFAAQWITALWFTAAMLAKEEYAAVPLLLILLDLSRRSSIRWRPAFVMLAIGLILGSRTVWATFAVRGSQAGPEAGISPTGYLLSQGWIILGYLLRFVLPWGFSVDHAATRPPIALAVVAWAAIAALVGAALFRFRSLGVGFWFIAGLILLAPSSSVFPAADLSSDHRMYLPLVAFAACASLMLQRLDNRILAAIALGLVAISIRYAYIWISPERLWREAVHQAPTALRPRLQLARALPPEDALAIIDRARELAPENPAVPTERGRILLALGRPGDALVAFGRAVALDPTNPVAINNRGAALLALGEVEPARADFKRALARDPCLFDARYNLARTGEPAPNPSDCPDTQDQKKMLER
jgi:protein O-mannosyl-transferase